uniref:Uncharacterized protein n=1 Tax=Tanacetum cinerariifolium TaxID=118510 RepID=A0A699GN28_TANCI|nr:hypothetical protein [Tanacetum cinerariifolium]
MLPICRKRIVLSRTISGNVKPEAIAEVIEVEQGLFDENPSSGSTVGVVHREDASGSKIDIRSEQCQPLRVSVPPVMAAPTIHVSADSFKGNFIDTIDISVDVIHPVPVALVVFPTPTVVMTLA